MANIVIYARYSSSAQTEQSIEGQLRVCREYASRKGYTIIHEYIDRAMTGTNADRPEFQKMIADSSKAQFEFVLVYKLDRFSRSKYDNAIYKHKLQQNGVRVISATEIISNTPEGVLMEGLLEMFAEMYSKDLSQKVTRGMRENILKGNFTGGNILYGYKVVDKKIKINEEQAPAIRFIFNEYAKGTSMNEIVTQLNEMGYRTNKGKKFTLNSLQYNLSNQKYIGIYKNSFVENNNYYPAIIDKNTFEKVQDMLKKNKRFSNKPKEKFILSSKLYCGHCGASMVGTSGTSHTGKTHSYYSCSERYKKHTCSKSNENKQKLEDDIFNFIFEKFLQRDNLNKIAEGILKSYENEMNNSELVYLEKQLEDIERKFDKLTNQILKSTNDAIITRLNKQADDLSEQKAIFAEQLKKLKLALSLHHTREDILEYLNVFLDQPKTEKFKETLLNTFVNSIYVFDDYINIYFDLFEKHEKYTLQQAKSHKEQFIHGFAHKTECSTMFFGCF